MQLDWPHAHGSLREQYERRSVSAGRLLPILVTARTPPHAAVHLWRWFWDLNSTRKGTGFGPAALGYDDIEAWKHATGAQPTAWEVAALRKMDQAYRKQCAAEQEIDRQDREAGKR